MDLNQFMTYCAAKTGTEETFPFDEHTLVYKVAGKMYALCGLERYPMSINLKCDPDYSLELREQYDGLIIPGYHMNKKYWNTVQLEADIEEKLYYELIDMSYNLVRNSLPKKVKEALDAEEKCR